MLSFVDVKPDEFWLMTPAEIKMILDRKVNDDIMAWNHTSVLISTILQPHVKKGTKLNPEKFHPYRNQKNKPTIDQVKDLLYSEATIKRNAELKEQWKGRKTVFQKLADKRAKNK